MDILAQDMDPMDCIRKEEQLCNIKAFLQGLCCSRENCIVKGLQHRKKSGAATPCFVYWQIDGYTGSGATKKYMTMKWQALPSITKM